MSSSTSPDTQMSSHVWVELIAFDVESDDLGVGRYLADLAHTPETLSLLVYSAAFLHEHVDGADETPLPVECTSYGARPVAARGPRQAWTQGQLRLLIALLKDRGIAVLFAVFDLHGYPTDEDGHTLSRYGADHPELAVRDRYGQARPGMINPLSRRSDGMLYADWFVADLDRVFSYYRFSGWHAADGLTSTRLPLWLGDFGRDYVALFDERHPGLVPPHQLRSDEPTEVSARADLLWSQHRGPWINYHADRFAELWSAAAAVVHRHGGIVVANNGWTRDPFESLYRFGSDYDRMQSSGIDAIILESSAAAIQLIESDGDEAVLAWILATAMLARLHTGGLPLRPLIGVHDWYEGWDVIGDARALLQRDIWMLSTPRVVTSDGASTRCISGLLWCLADSLNPERWRWLESQRQQLGPLRFQEEAMPTLIYDHASLADQFSSFHHDRSATPGRLLARLLRAGADLGRVSSPQTTLTSDTPAVVLRGDLQPAAATAARNQQSYAIVQLEAGAWVLYHAAPGVAEVRVVGGAVPDADPNVDLDIVRWTAELQMAEPEPSLMTALRDWINARAGASTSMPSMTRRAGTDAAEVVLLNHEPHYTTFELPYGDPMTSTRTSGTVIRRRAPGPEDPGGVTVQVPPGGISVVSVQGGTR